MRVNIACNICGRDNLKQNGDRGATGMELKCMRGNLATILMHFGEEKNWIDIMHFRR